MRQSRYILAALIFVVGLWGGVSSADNFTFTVGNDNMLVSYIPNNSYSNYSVKYQWGKPGSTIQTLIQFDDIIGSNPGQIPLGSTITNAMLNFYVYNGSSEERQVYQMTAGWDGSTTWNSMGGGVTVGSQTTGSPVASYTQSAGGFFGIDVSSSLQSWANGATNYGWAIMGSGSDGNDWSGIYALSYNNPNLRPTLTVEFTAPIGGVPEPGTLLLVGSALTGLMLRRRRRRTHKPKAA